MFEISIIWFTVISLFLVSNWGWNVWPKLAHNEVVFGKSIVQVPDTGTRVLANTRPFLRSSIVSFWMTPASSKGRKYHIFRQYWYTRNVPVFTNTGMFQYLGPEVYFFLVFLHNIWGFAFGLWNYMWHVWCISCPATTCGNLPLP